MISIIRYTFITAIRDLLFIGLLTTIITAIFISSFLGSTALVEQDQMTLSYMAGSTRLILIVGLVLFVCFHVRRSFDNKEIEVTLAKPISKSVFVIGYWIAFASLSIIMTLSLVIMIISLNINIVKIQDLMYWGMSLILEGLIMIAFSMLSALIMKSAVTSVLSSLSFYFVSRMMGFFIATIDHFPHNFSKEHFLQWASESILRIVSIILPRLDLFGKTSWLIHGISSSHDLAIIMYQSLIYIPLLLAVVIFDFKRKQF